MVENSVIYTLSQSTNTFFLLVCFKKKKNVHHALLQAAWYFIQEDFSPPSSLGVFLMEGMRINTEEWTQGQLMLSFPLLVFREGVQNQLIMLEPVPAQLIY